MATRRLELVFTGDTRGLERAFGRVASSSRSIESGAARSVRALGKMTAAGAAAGVAIAGAFGGLGIREAIAQEKVAARTVNVLRTTGGAAGVTRKEIEGLASALQDQTGVADDSIQASQNLLLTFTKVRNEAGKNNDIFTQGTKAALDMSVAMGTDLNGATLQVGKALNDPIKGVSALSRVGVSFTAQQKEQIRTLVESGRTMDAQKVILRELNTEFGGAAKAAGDTTAGQFEKLKRTVENAAEGFAVALLPRLNQLATFLRTEVVPRAMEVVAVVQKHWPAIQATIQAVVGAVVGWVRRHWGTISAVTTATFQAVVRAVRGAMDWIRENVVPTIQSVVRNAQRFWDRFGGTIKETFQVIVQVVRRALNVVRGVIEVFLAVIRGDWGAAWNGLKRIVSNVLGGLGDVIRGLGRVAVAAMKALGKLMLDGLVAALKGIASSVRSAVVTGLRSLGNLSGALLNAGKELGRKLVDGIVDAIKGAASRIAGAVKDSITGGLGSLGSTAVRALGLATGGFTPGAYTGRDPYTIRVDGNEAILNPRQMPDVVDRRTGLQGRAALTAIFSRTGGRLGGTAFRTGGAVSAGLQNAYRFARAQVGKGYTPGGTGNGERLGPNFWDCSGYATTVAAKVPGYRGRVGGTTFSEYPISTPATGDEPIVYGFRSYGRSRFGTGYQHMGVKVLGTWFDAGSGGVEVGDSRWDVLRVPAGLAGLSAGTGDPASDVDPTAPTGNRSAPSLTPFQEARRLFRRAGLGAASAAGVARDVLLAGGSRVTGASDRVAGGSLRTNEGRQVAGAVRTARARARDAGLSPDQVVAAGEAAERKATAKWLRRHIREIDTERRRLGKRKRDLLGDLKKLAKQKNTPNRRAAAKRIRKAIATIEAELLELLGLRAEANDALKELRETEEQDRYEAAYPDAEGDAGAEEEPPTEADYLDARAAEAALTEGTDDDLQVAKDREAFAQRELDAARASGDPRRIAAAAQALLNARDTRAQIEALRANTDAVNANTEAVQRSFGGSIAFAYRGQDYVLRSLAPPSSDRLDSSLLGV